MEKPGSARGQGVGQRLVQSPSPNPSASGKSVERAALLKNCSGSVKKGIWVVMVAI